MTIKISRHQQKVALATTALSPWVIALLASLVTKASLMDTMKFQAPFWIFLFPVAVLGAAWLSYNEGYWDAVEDTTNV